MTTAFQKSFVQWSAAQVDYTATGAASFAAFTATTGVAALIACLAAPVVANFTSAAVAKDMVAISATPSFAAFAVSAAAVARLSGVANATAPAFAASSAGYSVVDELGAPAFSAFTVAAPARALLNAASGRPFTQGFQLSFVQGAAPTFPAFVAMSSGASPPVAAVFETVPAFAVSAAAVARLSGSATVTAPAFAAASVGYSVVSELGAPAAPLFVASASGVGGIAGSAIATIPEFIVPWHIDVPITGSFYSFSTVPAFAVSAAAVARLSGSATVTAPAFAAASVGYSVVSELGAPAAPLFVASASGVGGIAGSAIATIPEFIVPWHIDVPITGSFYSFSELSVVAQSALLVSVAGAAIVPAFAEADRDQVYVSARMAWPFDTFTMSGAGVVFDRQNAKKFIGSASRLRILGTA